MKEILEKWLDKMGTLEFPVFQHTKERMQNEASLNNEIVTDILENDVGLAINIVHHVNTHARGHLNHRLTTLEYASMLLGIGSIREIALNSQTVEEQPEKLATHLLQAYGRALQSAMISREIAVMRNDLVPDELYLAGLLHSLGGLAMWLLAPNGMRTVRALLNDACRTPDEVEYLVFGFTQSNLSYALAKKWNMPAAVTEAMQTGAASQARLRGVMLAEQLSYVSANGCHRYIVADNLAKIGDFLRRQPDEVMERLLAIHNYCLKVAKQYGVVVEEKSTNWGDVLEGPETKELPAGEVVEKAEPESLAVHDDGTIICLAPRVDLMSFMDQYMEGDDSVTLDELFEQAVNLLHDAVGLNRVSYATVMSDLDCLKSRFTSGADRDIDFNLWSIELERDSVFKQLLEQNSSIWVTPAKWERMPELIPDSLVKINPTHSFFSQALYVRGKAHGVFYADRRLSQCQLEHTSFQRFQELVGKCQLLVNQRFA